MIKKFFEIEKVNLIKNYIFLFYGENDGLKSDVLKKHFEKMFSESVYRYDEKIY